MEKRTLHEAMEAILREIPDKQASIEVLSEEIWRRKLWRKKPPPKQVGLRALSYPEKFEVIVRLRE